MRKFVRIALVICLVVTAVTSTLVAVLWLWTWHKTAQIDSFYREHLLLSEMRARQKASTNDSAPARQALLEAVPLSTDRDVAIAALRKQGFGCKTIAEPITDTRVRLRFPEADRSGKDLVDCQTISPAVLGYVQWIMDLEFDSDGHLSEARVAIWNIFL